MQVREHKQTHNLLYASPHNGHSGRQVVCFSLALVLLVASSSAQPPTVEPGHSFSIHLARLFPTPACEPCYAGRGATNELMGCHDMAVIDRGRV